MRQWSIVTQRQRIDVGRQPTFSRASVSIIESVSVRTNGGASMSVKFIVGTFASIRVRAGASTSASVTDSASIIGSVSVRTSVSACIGVKDSVRTCASVRVTAGARPSASVKDSANVCLRQMYSKWKS